MSKLTCRDLMSKVVILSMDFNARGISECYMLKPAVTVLGLILQHVSTIKAVGYDTGHVIALKLGNNDMQQQSYLF